MGIPFSVWAGWYCLAGVISFYFLAWSRPELKLVLEKAREFHIGVMISTVTFLVILWPLWVPTRLFRLAQHLVHSRQVIARVKAVSASAELVEKELLEHETHGCDVGEFRTRFEEAKKVRDEVVAQLSECSKCRENLKKAGIPVPPKKRSKWEL